MKCLLSLCAVLLLSHAGEVLAKPYPSKLSTVNSDKLTQLHSQNKQLSIDSSGYVRKSGSILGQIDSNNYVRDASGSIIGKIDDSTGYIRNAQDRIIGQIDNTGYIRDGDGRIIGQYDSNGYVRDANGQILTNTDSREAAIFAIFFQN